MPWPHTRSEGSSSSVLEPACQGESRILPDLDGPVLPRTRTFHRAAFGDTDSSAPRKDLHQPQAPPGGIHLIQSVTRRTIRPWRGWTSLSRASADQLAIGFQKCGEDQWSGTHCVQCCRAMFCAPLGGEQMQTAHHGFCEARHSRWRSPFRFDGTSGVRHAAGNILSESNGHHLLQSRCAHFHQRFVPGRCYKCRNGPGRISQGIFHQAERSAGSMGRRLRSNTIRVGVPSDILSEEFHSCFKREGITIDFANFSLKRSAAAATPRPLPCIMLPVAADLLGNEEVSRLSPQYRSRLATHPRVSRER